MLPATEIQRRLRKARAKRGDRFDVGEKLVSRLSGAVARWWVDIAEHMRSQVSMSVIARAVSSNNPAPIIAAIGGKLDARLAKQQRPSALNEIERTLVDAARAAYIDEQERLSVELREDAEDFEEWALRNPQAIAWARSEAAKLVTQVSDSTKEGIRQAVAEAYESGIPTGEAAKNIRRSIGLLPRQSAALQRQIASMREDGKPSAAIERTSRATVNRMLRERAEMIARTEMNAAQNHGRQELWGVAIEDGALPANMMQRWDSGQEDPTCEICLELHGQTVRLGEMFGSSYVGKLDAPPAHPHCRCSVSSVFPDDD